VSCCCCCCYCGCTEQGSPVLTAALSPCVLSV
jgi:hypothetical protein